MAHPDPLPSTRHLLTSLISTIASSTQQNDTEFSNPLSTTTGTSQNTRSAFLTLHSLFPHDFLPALDLLDRGLVTRFVLAGGFEEHEVRGQLESEIAGNENENNDPTEDERRRLESPQDENQIPNSNYHQTEQQTRQKRKRKQTIVYQVRSAQRTKTSSSRSEQQTSTTSYEVRLKAWNCSCPAFAFAALPVDAAENGHRDDGSEDETAGYGLSGHKNVTATTDEEEKTAWLGFGGLTRGKDVPVCKHLLACVVAERCRGFEALMEEREVGVEEVAGWAAGWGD